MKGLTTIKALREKRLELLKEEINLVQVEEMLQRTGEHEEAVCVRAERNELYIERKVIESRLKFFLVEDESA